MILGIRSKKHPSKVIASQLILLYILFLSMFIQANNLKWFKNIHKYSRNIFFTKRKNFIKKKLYNFFQLLYESPT